MIRCYWCNKEFHGYYLTYKGHTFCRDNADRCLKDFLYDEADDLIGLDYDESPEQTEFIEKNKQKEW